jgi:sugar lactone lactonase YvrE
MALRNTRSLAIAQSNEYYVYFNPAGFAAGTIEVVVQPYSNGVAQPQSEVAAYTLPSDVSFAVQTGFPNTTAGTPDGFGTAANAIEFGEGLAGAPDGSSQDGQGNYNSGIVYLTRTGDTLSNSRAVTVWGATGRVRGWRLVQSKGVWEWVQQ